MRFTCLHLDIGSGVTVSIEALAQKLIMFGFRNVLRVAVTNTCCSVRFSSARRDWGFYTFEAELVRNIDLIY
jgi:hypothetical protein